MKLPIALSNKHVHLSQADVDVLFGEGYQLTPLNHYLNQDNMHVKKKLL